MEMRYQKSVAAMGGAWIKGKDLLDGNVQKIKIVSDTVPTPSSQFKDKRGNPQIQDVCQVLVPGDPEKKNFSMNMTSINGLIDAFGDESTNWINKVVAVKVKKKMIGGEVKYPVYLVPEGFELTKDEFDNDVVQKIIVGRKTTAKEDEEFDKAFDAQQPQAANDGGEITVEDIPF